MGPEVGCTKLWFWLQCSFLVFTLVQTVGKFGLVTSVHNNGRNPKICLYSEVWNLMYKKYKSNFKSVFSMIYTYEALLKKNLFTLLSEDALQMMLSNATSCQYKESLTSPLAKLKQGPFLYSLLSQIVAKLSTVPIPADHSWLLQLTPSLLAQQPHAPCVAISYRYTLEAGEMSARHTWYLSPAVRLSDKWLEQRCFKVILQKFLWFSQIRSTLIVLLLLCFVLFF